MNTTHAVLDKPAQILGLRAICLMRGLELEMKNPGMRLTNKAPKCSTIIRRELGFKGSTHKIYCQYLRYLNVQGIINLSPDSVDLINEALD
jgi:hypothetical protein